MSEHWEPTAPVPPTFDKIEPQTPTPRGFKPLNGVGVNMPADEFQIRDLRELASPLIEAAIDTVAPNDGIIWDITWMPGPAGLNAWLVFVVASPILGQPLVVGCPAADARWLTKQDVVTNLTRGLVEQYRNERASMATLPPVTPT